MPIKNKRILIIGPFPEPLFGVSLSNLVLENKYNKVGISPPEYLGGHHEFINNYLKERGVIYRSEKEVLN